LNSKKNLYVFDTSKKYHNNQRVEIFMECKGQLGAMQPGQEISTKLAAGRGHAPKGASRKSTAGGCKNAYWRM
jgi:hypothetical protein